MRKTWWLPLLLLFCYCQNPEKSAANSESQIIETLQLETRYFCERNLEMWQEQWSHKAFTSKMYTGQNDFEEFTGWAAINGFTVKHIVNNPDPIPLPDTNFDVDIHLLGETAWVFYSKTVNGALVKETRFMVKEDDKWKIARMQTIF